MRHTVVRLSMVLLLGLILLAACLPQPETPVELRLLGSQITAADLAGRDPAQVDGLPLGEVLLADEEILGYDREEHAILVTTEAWERLNTMGVPVNGVPFAVCVDGEPLYAGCLWTMVSSLSYDGVTILLPAMGEDDRLPIELGYPGSDFFSWDDPRDDARLLEALHDR